MQGKNAYRTMQQSVKLDNVKRAFTGRQPVHILVLCCFVIFVLILPFKHHVFLLGFSPRRIKSRLGELGDEKKGAIWSHLAQAR